MKLSKAIEGFSQDKRSERFSENTSETPLLRLPDGITGRHKACPLC
jgi:hypothetical protein